MNNHHKHLLLPLFGLLTVLIFAAPLLLAARPPSVSSSRYDIIDTRHPFGKEPPPPAPEDTNKEPPVTTEELSFAKDMKVVYIRRWGSGFRVGITDSKTKTTLILDLGETDPATGITLVEANYDSQSAKLRKGRAEAWVDAGGTSRSKPPTARRTYSSSPAPTPPQTAGRRRLTYSERVKIREERNRKAHELAEKGSKFASQEELRKHLEDYQMQLIRTGDGPPLPMQLTPEMDEQLVNEGVLPPLE